MVEALGLNSRPSQPLAAGEGVVLQPPLSAPPTAPHLTTPGSRPATGISQAHAQFELSDEEKAEIMVS